MKGSGPRSTNEETIPCFTYRCPPPPSLPFSSKAFQCAHKPTSRFTVSSQNILGQGDKLSSNLCSSPCLSYTKTQRPGLSFSKKLCGLLKPVAGRITNLFQLPESYDQRGVMQSCRQCQVLSTLPYTQLEKPKPRQVRDYLPR